MTSVTSIYRRAFDLLCERPWLALLPALAELAQHVVEIQVGMYAGGMDTAGGRMRLGFGAVKVLAIFITIVVAWRLWRFGGDTRRALRPTGHLFRGIAIFILVQLLGDVTALATGRGLTALAGDPARSLRILLTVAPLLGWLFVSAVLLPWYVGLATEDQTMTLRRSVRASRGRLLATWGLFVAGYLPLMVVHYALGYAALRGAPAWPVMVVDALLVGGLALALAATYYVIYLRAQERVEPGAEGAPS